MNYSLLELFSYSIVLPAGISLFFLKRLEHRFLPFFLFLWTGLLGEVATTLIINAGGSNAVVGNVYVLLEALLLTWFFKKFDLFSHRKWFYGFLIFFILFWIGENLIFSSLGQFNSYFRIVYSFSLVLMSISQINKLLVEENKSVLLHPVFLICIAFVIFFTYKTLVEIFWVYGLNSSDQFNKSVYRILSIINLFANLLYALACLWIRRKQEYSLL
jgi:hypothetical protein